MTPDALTALRDAAFHAWVAIGEALASDRLTRERREEFEATYAALHVALKATSAGSAAPPVTPPSPSA